MGENLTSGAEPFFFDGNPANPVKLLGDINPGSADAGYNRCNFVELDGAVYFSVQDSAHGIELWCVNCTPSPIDTSITDTGDSLGLNKSMVEGSTMLYPNPFQEKLTLDLAKAGGTVQILDIRGTLISSDEITGRRVEISTKGLPAGTYFLRVLQEDDIRSFQILKE